jgi:hypothetical protein
MCYDKNERIVNSQETGLVLLIIAGCFKRRLGDLQDSVVDPEKWLTYDGFG